MLAASTRSPFQGIEDRHCIVQDRRICRVRPQLLPQYGRERTPRRGDQNQAGDVGRLPRRQQRHQTALAVPQHPYAGNTCPRADGGYPRMDVRRVVVDHDIIGIRYRRRAAVHAALVDSYRRDTFFAQTFREQPVRRRLKPARRVAISVGRARFPARSAPLAYRQCPGTTACPSTDRPGRRFDFRLHGLKPLAMSYRQSLQQCSSRRLGQSQNGRHRIVLDSLDIRREPIPLRYQHDGPRSAP